MIAGKTWRELRAMAVIYLLILELLAVPIILLWPDFYGDLQKSSFFRNLPSIGRPIGEGITNKNEQIAYTNWIALMLYFRSVNLAGIAASGPFGTALFAREREAQTFEFLLGRPVSRRHILWAKFWPTALCVTVPIFLVNWSAILWSHHIELELSFARITLASLHGALFALCFLSFTTWVSVFCRVQAHVAFWVGGVTIVQIGVYLTQVIRTFSIFHMSDFEWYAPILLGNTAAWQMFDPVRGSGLTTYVIAATLLFYGLAWRALKRAEL